MTLAQNLAGLRQIYADLSAQDSTGAAEVAEEARFGVVQAIVMTERWLEIHEAELHDSLTCSCVTDISEFRGQMGHLKVVARVKES